MKRKIAFFIWSLIGIPLCLSLMIADESVLLNSAVIAWIGVWIPLALSQELTRPGQKGDKT